MRTVDVTVLVGSLLQDTGIVVQPLAGIAVIVDEAVLRPDPLAKPDHHVVVDTQIPECVDWDALYRNAANPPFPTNLSHLLGKI